MAKEIVTHDQSQEDNKKIIKITELVNKMVGKKNRVSKDTVKDQLSHIHRRLNIEKEKFENEMMELI